MRCLASLLLLVALPSAGQTPPPSTEDLEEAVRKFVAVFATAVEHAAEKPDLDSLFYRGAIPAMLRPLDPHSVFFDREQFEQLKELERSVTKGFGTIVSILPGRVIILQTMPGSPSQKAGLAPGDEILAINNIPLAFLDLDQLLQLLSYARQREAQLLVRRSGEPQPVAVKLSPAELESPSVDRSFLVEPDIAYVRVSSFDAKTAEALRETVEKLGGEKLKGLVLDLRNNQGGVVQSAVAAAALFLEPGSVLFAARGRNTPKEELRVPEGFSPWRFKLAVLVNGKTASAAELFAGAIQDNDRGVILGEPTFGKGLVQRVYPLSDGTGLALTTAFYYTPSGRSIQKPLRGTELDGAAAQEAREYRTRLGRIVRGGGGIEPDFIVYQQAYSAFGRVLEASGAYPNFATEWLKNHPSQIDSSFDISPEILDEFQLWLSRRNIRPTVAEWTSERETMRRRLKQEILNQAVSVAAGDEVELRADPVVRRALSLIKATPADRVP
ncbi:MAG: S41 family peptidase [Bryobacteraceae bacterium]|nr:S41 family peptidase [Bryobacteraceae bacterium]